MRASQNFAKSRKEIPSDEVSKNAQLLIRAGYIYKEMAGVYAYLPMGLKVIENIKSIIREEMNSLGAQEMIMTNLQRKELWEITDRWSDEQVDIWFKSKLKNDSDVGFAWSHEEPITQMMTEYITSYRDLPANVYQFQTKLRNETRAKSGIMRTREFVMKDLYSYSISEEQHKKFYDSVTEAYLRIFKKVGLGETTYLTFASGGAFTQFSHEFQTLVEAGEDTIFLDEKNKIAINEEVFTDEVIKQLGLEKGKLKKHKAAEVGNIFSFGTAKCEDLGLKFDNEDGESRYVVLGSYGIGIGRLMGVIVEQYADEAGLVWPDPIAPYKVHLVSLSESTEVRKSAEKLYKDLAKEGIEVYYDDRDERAGIKLRDADLLGLPHRVVVSERTMKAGGVEYKKRSSKTAKSLTYSELLKILNQK